MDKETKYTEHYWPCVHIQEEDATSPNGYRRMSYEIATSDAERLSELNGLIMAINEHFPKIKMWMTGERWEDKDQILTREIGNSEDEANAPTEYGKYVDECLNEASKHFFSEGEDKYSVADLFYAGVRCGKSWFENQNVEKETAKKIEKLVEENEEMKRKIHSDGLLRAASFQN